jgi:hypothetical protein
VRSDDAFLSLVLLSLVACAGAGRAPLPPPGAVAPRAEVAPVEPPLPAGLERLTHLLTFSGTATTVRYTPGALDRAARVQERAELLAAVFHKIDARPAGLKLWVLDRRDWETAGLDHDYGLPEVLGSGAFAVPAEGDLGQVDAIAELLGGSPPVSDSTPLRGTAEEAAALGVADEIFQIDAARDFGERVGLRGDRPWVTGVLAHLVARIAFEKSEPGRMPSIAAVFDRIAVEQGGLASRRLDDYAPGLPLEVDLWYQAQLLRGADVLWVREGENGSIRYLYRKIQQRTPVPAAELERAYPALAAWRATSFAP